MQGISLAGLSYYFDGVTAAPTDELPDPNEVARYGGATALHVGIKGREVHQSELGDLLQGKGALAGRGVALPRVRHAFIDVVFTCPKSVSLLFGLASAPERALVVAAHVVARDSALAYLERRCAWAKMPTGTRALVRADGLIWAPFVHHVSRSGDPHLHSHVVVANLVPSSARGWSPLDSGPLFSERLCAAQLYRAALRFELAERLGLGFRTRSDAGSDVIGFSDHVLDAFSKRRSAIAAMQREQAPPTPRETLSRRHRATPKKETEAPLAELHDSWELRAHRLGVMVHRDIAVTTSASLDLELRKKSLSRRVDDAVDRSVSGFDASFTRRELVTSIGKALEFGAPIEFIEDRVATALESLEVTDDRAIVANANSSARYDQRHSERYVNARVAAAAAHEAQMLRQALSEADIHTLFAKSTLWPKQLGLGVISTRLTPIRSYAMLRAIRQAAFDRALPFRLVSPSPTARSGFEAATGAEVPSALMTPNRTTPGLTVVVDSARLSVWDRTRYVDAARKRGDLVVLCDPPTGETSPFVPDDALSLSTSAATNTIRHYVTGDITEVLVVDSLAQALRELRELADGLGDAAKIVVGHRLSPGIAVPESPRSGSQEHVRRHEADSTSPVLLVLGDARLLRREDQASSRIHVVVAPPEMRRADERALAFAMAGWIPRGLRGVSLSKEASDRMAWGWQALVRRDRLDVRAVHELAPERIAIGGAERQRRDARANEQGGMVAGAVRDDIGWETTLAP